MRLSALFDEFCQFLRLEREATPRTVQTYRYNFEDSQTFAHQSVGGPALVHHFTADLCRAYQDDLARRHLQTNTIRVRLATLGSFGKWAVRRDKLDRNPVDLITRPRRKARLPHVPRWGTVETVLAQCATLRERAIVALMAYGGLRRREVAALNVGDLDLEFGLRRLVGKGGHETALPLPAPARTVLAAYLAAERSQASASAPLFVVQYRTRGGHMVERRILGQRIWKRVKVVARRVGIPELHPHAFRHGCGVELHRRTGGNLRAVRHTDIQTTTVYMYTQVTGQDLAHVVRVFDQAGDEKKV